MTDRTIIIQPSIPKYRRRFFDMVCEQRNILVVASEVSIDGANSEVEAMKARIRMLPVRFFGGRFAWQSGLVGLVMKEEMDALVLSGNPRYLSTLLALVIAKFRGVRVIWWGHVMSSSSSGPGARIRMLLMRLANRLLVYYTEEIPFLPQGLQSRTSAVDNTIDTQAVFAAHSAVTDEARVKFRVQHDLDDRPLLVTIGRLTPKSEMDLLVDAFAVARKSGLEARLAILGDGPQQKDLRFRAATLGVADDILWAGAIYDEESIAQWMTCASAFVYAGAVGLSLIHAFAYGLPAIIHDDIDGHNPEARVFEDGKHGVQFVRGHSSSLAAALQRLLNTPEEARAMGEAALALMESRLTIEHMVKNFCTALEDGAP